VDGPPGVGKSLVARRWLDQLAADVPRAVVANPHAAGPAELLQAVLFDLGRPYQGLSTQELRLAVTAELLGDGGREHPTVLVIDEAQNLTPAAVEELRLLGNVETADGAAAFVLLVAQPGLRDSLGRAFAQRVAARHRVEPFTPDEAAAYLRHQAGAALDDEAVSVLAGASGGVPRVLNQAAALAGELAAGAGADRVDAEAALEALARLGLDPPAEEPPVARPARKPARKRAA
ncbi:MAG: ATP-binding protein, partial [Gemmataceae bacterium]|nr:ATP-binding protein [Gemmataceae bacterium]